MKVNNNRVSQNLGINQAKSSKMDPSSGLKADKNSSAAAPSLEKVALSQKAQSMQKAKAIAGDMSVDEAKVARLQKLIDSGEYKTDASAIADRLVDEHLKTL